MSTPAPAADAQGLHDNRAHQLIVATIFAILLPTVFVVLRLLARHVLRIRLYFDDWLIIIAWFFKIGLDISNSLLIKHGIGRHISTLGIPSLVKFMQLQYTLVIQYPLCITAIKLSILFQYRRLFPKHRDFLLMTSALIAMMIMWCCSVLLTGVFICTPIRKAWTPWLDGRCIDLVPFYYGMQIPNVVTDVLILLLPLREVQRLDLPRQQKMGVAVTCLLWVISLVCGVIRLAVMVQLAGEGMDLTWNLVPAAIMTTVEPAVQICTACLPSLRVLWRKYLDARKQKSARHLRNIELEASM
ncbi:uncharacterized protein M437DRAFT_56656 [Aureobasidium melanogenum CBS 110374]|uniref:Rhodopsin domain-containing protein n=1 Tax=Aureobasidium melanogenum (strain CBS 110374) TaxID=1043003 RepID=A0A074WAI0_AURM1|nr:uncharacterized protein M437DRAFT_56656 [Aureobasidium melanogenum CBS 110374]KEQ59521.1 hypothetical protein M437DRAFT_56656 [Aureobasidium melanogenum CBS 110374]